MVKVSVGGEGQFFYSHLQWRGILKPSSAPFLGVIQDMYLDSTHKGREAFSKVKAYLRRVEFRSREALVDAIGRALSTITTRDARGYFKHCGFRVQAQLYQ